MEILKEIVNAPRTHTDIFGWPSYSIVINLTADECSSTGVEMYLHSGKYIYYMRGSINFNCAQNALLLI